jgi:hypothetical protein
MADGRSTDVPPEHLYGIRRCSPRRLRGEVGGVWGVWEVWGEWETRGSGRLRGLRGQGRGGRQLTTHH